MTPLPPERLLLPFDAAPFRMAMALQGAAPDTLVEIDDRYPAEMAERRDLLVRRHADVFAAQPGSEPARAETLDLLAACSRAAIPPGSTATATRCTTA